MSDQIVQFAVRRTTNDRAIVLVHGFHGDSHQTFGMLPAFLAGHPDCYRWDIHCFGYPSALAPDISGVWSADPDLTTLSGYLATNISVRFEQYKHVALIAHSMGGLIVQRALLDGNFQDRVSHVLLFGAPSDGLRKAGLGKLFKRQARDMTAGGPFVTNLRSDWNRQFPSGFPFAFRAVAGIRDEFVPRNSSVDPFPLQFRAYVAGNHLEMVKPQTADADTTLLVLHELSATPGSRGISPGGARPASVYDRTVEELLPQKEKLDEKQLVKLALALEMTGRQSEAIGILKARREGSEELTGVLAGRLKRLWLCDPVTNGGNGREALELYSSAFRQAAAAGHHESAFYNGINVAFMTLATGGSRDDVRQIALDVLVHCQQAPPDMWRLATEAEASLYLGETDAALRSYAAALDKQPDPREADSMYKQAVWAARLLDNSGAEARLDKLFQETR